VERGRTYVRNGSVVDLQISPGRLDAIVAGSDPYEIKIEIKRLKSAQWKKVCDACAASIDSLLDLLSGQFSDGVMQRLTDRDEGLFPTPGDIHMSCSCPDWAVMCKHVAAVLYGVGAHLDKRPELLFVLRDVDHHELVSEAVSQENLSTAFGEPSDELAGEDLGAMFGIELDAAAPSSKARQTTRKRRSRTTPAVRKKTAKTRSPKTSSAKTKPVKSKSANRPTSAGANAKAAAKKKSKSSQERQSAERTVPKKSPKKKPAKKKSSPRKSPGKKPSRRKAAKAKSPTGTARGTRATDSTS
jgi:uncharacterized Zn finger protein